MGATAVPQPTAAGGRAADGQLRARRGLGLPGTDGLPRQLCARMHYHGALEGRAEPPRRWPGRAG